MLELLLGFVAFCFLGVEVFVLELLELVDLADELLRTEAVRFEDVAQREQVPEAIVRAFHL